MRSEPRRFDFAMGSLMLALNRLIGARPFGGSDGGGSCSRVDPPLPRKRGTTAARPARRPGFPGLRAGPRERCDSERKGRQKTGQVVHFTVEVV